MPNSKETLINQLTVYANSHFKWDGRAEYVLKIDERLSTYPVKKRESVLDKLIEDQSDILMAQPDHDSFSSYERTTTIEKIIRTKVKKIGYEAIDREFGSKMRKLDRFQELADIIAERLENCDLKLQKYYDEGEILSESKFSNSKPNEIQRIFKEFHDQMLIELKDLETDFKDIENYIETYVNNGYENILEQIRISLKGSIKDIMTAITKPIVDSIEVNSGRRFINPDIVLIHKIKHNNWDVRVKLDERVHSYRKDLDQLVLTEILGGDEIERIQGLIIATDKRDILLKKAGQTISSDTSKKMMDVISDLKIKNDKRIAIDEKKRAAIVEDFAKLVDNKLLSVQDAKYWLSADFQGFSKPDNPNRVISIPGNRGNKGIIKHFVYLLYMKYQMPETKQSSYREMLKHRINLFQSDSDKKIEDHFAKGPKSYPDKLKIHPI